MSVCTYMFLYIRIHVYVYIYIHVVISNVTSKLSFLSDYKNRGFKNVHTVMLVLFS